MYTYIRANTYYFLLQGEQEAKSFLETDDQSAVREVKLAYENVKVVDCLDLTSEGSAAWEAALKRLTF